MRAPEPGMGSSSHSESDPMRSQHLRVCATLPGHVQHAQPRVQDYL